MLASDVNMANGWILIGNSAYRYDEMDAIYRVETQINFHMKRIGINECFSEEFSSEGEAKEAFKKIMKMIM